jgi:hypothetical protein
MKRATFDADRSPRRCVLKRRPASSAGVGGMLNHRCGRGPSLMGQRPKGMARYAMVDYEAFIQELEVAGVEKFEQGS